jgi:hypothetical protein
MTTTYASVSMVAGGKPYFFTVDATDTSEATMVNVVSSRGLGDTFSQGTTITSIGPCILNSSDGTGASKSILGAVILDPQNNVVYQSPYVDPETAPIEKMYPCSIPVGLNFKMVVLTVNA